MVNLMQVKHMLFLVYAKLNFIEVMMFVKHVILLVALMDVQAKNQLVVIVVQIQMHNSKIAHFAIQDFI